MVRIYELRIRSDLRRQRRVSEIGLSGLGRPPWGQRELEVQAVFRLRLRRDESLSSADLLNFERFNSS